MTSSLRSGGDVAAPTADLTRRVAAETLGTAVLVATVVGSGIMAQSLTDDVALALLANGLATGAILVVLITIVGPISGAHFNPAVSLVAALRGLQPWTISLLYMAGQVLGGLAGTLVAHAMFGQRLLQLSTTGRSGGAQWLSEAVATFGLVAVIMAGARFQRSALPWLVGLYITAAYWFTASTSFANPAVTVGRVFTDSFAGIRPLDAPVFVAVQLGAAVAAMWATGWLLKPWPETSS
jgi:glycerol uptake facilitator-like aquaporin